MDFTGKFASGKIDGKLNRDFITGKIEFDNR